jgi:hypothetical protein
MHNTSDRNYCHGLASSNECKIEAREFNNFDSRNCAPIVKTGEKRFSHVENFVITFRTLSIVLICIRNISETGLCLRPQEQGLLCWAQSTVPISLPLAERGPSHTDWVGFLFQDGDRVQSPKRFKYKLGRRMISRKFVIIY